jgi:hypothetical protein
MGATKVKKEVREQIRQERGSLCDECHEPGTRFCFQRKKNVRKHPEMANDAGNVWMRCEPCQRRWEDKRAANRRPSASVNSKFRKRVRAERGQCCEVCGTPGPTPAELTTMTPTERSRRTLHLHHKSKQRTHPEIRCKRENLVLCCQPCHVRLEAELNIELREQSAEGGNRKTVEHSVSKATSNTSSTADLNSAARVPGGAASSPPKLYVKCSGAERPKVSPSKTFVYGDEIFTNVDVFLNPSARAQEVTPEVTPGNTGALTDDALPQNEGSGCVYTPKNRLPLGVHLRQQAIKNGLTPGSPRWRAYVLGTLQASKKRKAKKRKGGETGLVTPVK